MTLGVEHRIVCRRLLQQTIQPSTLPSFSRSLPFSPPVAPYTQDTESHIQQQTEQLEGLTAEREFLTRKLQASEAENHRLFTEHRKMTERVTQLEDSIGRLVDTNVMYK